MDKIRKTGRAAAAGPNRFSTAAMDNTGLRHAAKQHVRYLYRMHATLKRFFLCIVLPALALPAPAQDGKRFHLRAGFGFAGYGTTTEWTFKLFDPDVVVRDEDGAATIHVPVEARYHLSDRWNLGLDLKMGSYLYDPDSAEGRSNWFFVIGPGAEYNLMRTDRFRWYLGFGLNAAFLELEENFDVLGVPVQEIARYGGRGVRLNTGVLIFLGSAFGLNFNLGYDQHRFVLREFERNGTLQDLDLFEAVLNVQGADATLGLVVRL
jgi:hypothetical protein